MVFLPWLIGGAIAAVAAIASSSDDEDIEQENARARALANLEAANRKRHLDAEARKREKARLEEQRRQEVRNDFDGIASTKLREFKVKSRLAVTLSLKADDCSFRSYPADCKDADDRVNAAIARRFADDIAESDAESKKLRDLKRIIDKLEMGVA